MHEREGLGRYVYAVYANTPSADIRLATGGHARFRIIGCLNLSVVIHEGMLLLVAVVLLNYSVGGVSRNASSYQPEELHLLTDYGI